MFSLFVFLFFDFAVNKLITDKMQNIFSLITEHSGWKKLSLTEQEY